MTFPIRMSGVQNLAIIASTVAFLSSCVFTVPKDTFPAHGGSSLTISNAKLECLDERNSFQSVKNYDIKSQAFGQDWSQYYLSGSTGIGPKSFAPFRISDDSFLLISKTGSGEKDGGQTIYVLQFANNIRWAYILRYPPGTIERIAKDESIIARTYTFGAPWAQTTGLRGSKDSIVRFFTALIEARSSAVPMAICRVFPTD